MADLDISFNVSPAKRRELLERMAKLEIREEDLVEKFVKGSGRGGQKINKTSSCVYLKHLPSGIEVKIQRERSQALNRYFARRTLCDKLAALIEGRRSAEQERIARVRRQKRRRSRRAQEKVLDSKRARGEAKENRRPPEPD